MADRDYENDFAPAKWYEFVLGGIVIAIIWPIVMIGRFFYKNDNLQD